MELCKSLIKRAWITTAKKKDLVSLQRIWNLGLAKSSLQRFVVKRIFSNLAFLQIRCKVENTCILTYYSTLLSFSQTCKSYYECRICLFTHLWSFLASVSESKWSHHHTTEILTNSISHWWIVMSLKCSNAEIEILDNIDESIKDDCK